LDTPVQLALQQQQQQQRWQTQHEPQ
jgi:hypothetical protein